MLSAPDLRYPIGRFSRPENITPELRLEACATIAALPGRIVNAIRNLTSGQLDTPYRDGGWTVCQLLHHIADAHGNGYVRIRLALTEENPVIKAFDENAWAELNDKTAPAEWSLDLLTALHARWAYLLKSLDEIQWKRTFQHPEHQDPQSVEFATLLYAWHSRHHTAHITALRERNGW